MIALAIGAAVVVIYKLRHHSSLRRRDTTVQTNDTLNVAKGTEKYLLEPGRVYVPVGAEARVARVEAADGNWFGGPVRSRVWAAAVPCRGARR
jgi:hypothetical protein